MLEVTESSQKNRLTGISAGALNTIYSANAPFTVNNLYYGSEIITEGKGRSRHLQGAYQLACMACTLAISIVGGLATGLILRFVPWLDQPDEHQMYDDSYGWELPETCVDIEEGSERVSTIRVGLGYANNTS
ncbi:unnamed protein product [Protopolystoma xenopodis]|uniref:Uncharacterized protein n=1 Tax=Protopolystoma xenopodis TaxID=117903 RepID=A0A3S5AXX8_9PLAT|nr:unnamed protein product [Protopolystoma xenopodis]